LSDKFFEFKAVHGLVYLPAAARGLADRVRQTLCSYRRTNSL
jgi:hypothetical protein